MDPLTGALISGGTRLLGGLLGDNAAEKNAKRNIQLQKEFAQTGIQWKVADAKAAGVHPVYALGASTTPFAPVSVGQSNMSQALSGFGQDISRATAATATSQSRLSSAAQGLQLENMGLQNALLRSQIARINQGTGPPMPLDARWGLDGQGSTTAGSIATGSGSAPSSVPGISLVENRPLQRSVDPAGPYSEPGHVADVGHALTHSGRYAILPSKEAQERMEDQIWPQLYWALRNMWLPESWGGERSHPPFGHPNQWRYLPWAGSWEHEDTDHYFRNPDGSQWSYSTRDRDR